MKTKIVPPNVRLRLLPLIIFALILQSTLAFAINWNGGGVNTDISTGTNWVGGVAPGSAAFGYFDLNSGTFYTVSSTNAYSIGGIYVATDKVSFDFTGNTVTLAGGQDFIVGYGGLTGQARLVGGTMAAVGVHIGGDTSGGNGSLTIDNAVLTTSNRLNVGTTNDITGNTGNLTVQNGGQVTASSNGILLAMGGTASILVSGTGSSLTASTTQTASGTQSSTSTVTVENGASYSTGGSFFASKSTNATTHITVQNSGTMSIGAHLGLGGTTALPGGTASLSITNGSTVSTGLDTYVMGGGVLNLSNSVLATRYVIVGNNTVGQAGATLVGSGTINTTAVLTPYTEISGVFKPGDTYTPGGGVVANIGTLVIGGNVNNIDLQLRSLANTTFDFTSASSFDKVFVFGDFSAGGVLNLNMNFNPWNGGSGTSFTLFDISAAHIGSGSFSSVNLTAGYTLVSAGFVGNDYVIHVIPEPTSASMLYVGLASLCLLSRFRRRRNLHGPSKSSAGNPIA